MEQTLVFLQIAQLTTGQNKVKIREIIQGFKYKNAYYKMENSANFDRGVFLKKITDRFICSKCELCICETVVTRQFSVKV
jgi:hypothetical protein